MVLPLIHHYETVNTVAVQKHAQVDNMLTHLTTGLGDIPNQWTGRTGN
jgi:hypothetical protein